MSISVFWTMLGYMLVSSFTPGPGNILALNVKIYFYIMTLLMVYLVPYITTLPGLLLAGVGVVGVGGTACLTWAFLGIKMQRIYEKHYKSINFILSLFLLYCAWDIVRG